MVTGPRRRRHQPQTVVPTPPRHHRHRQRIAVNAPFRLRQRVLRIVDMYLDLGPDRHLDIHVCNIRGVRNRPGRLCRRPNTRIKRVLIRRIDAYPVFPGRNPGDRERPIGLRRKLLVERLVSRRARR